MSKKLNKDDTYVTDVALQSLSSFINAGFPGENFVTIIVQDKKNPRDYHLTTNQHDLTKLERFFKRLSKEKSPRRGQVI